ncbi:hypothetical protein TEA_001522 [Camellia sinensis var. sinensis]|uniref:Uncharacterized protein n=1 Tax=Camellia sinensis var. sinensis TaxID=542762 RepID=A0A4S4E9Y0_CAMSN|nr:hypothetical protein TEA_001522 [Camellia sinensis var. sinensis]
MVKWSLEGHNEDDLGEFCEAIEITPRSFKVWMKNNKNMYLEYEESLSSDDSGRFVFSFVGFLGISVKGLVAIEIWFEPAEKLLRDGLIDCLAIEIWFKAAEKLQRYGLIDCLGALVACFSG